MKANPLAIALTSFTDLCSRYESISDSLFITIFKAATKENIEGLDRSQKRIVSVICQSVQKMPCSSHEELLNSFFQHKEEIESSLSQNNLIRANQKARISTFIESSLVKRTADAANLPKRSVYEAVTTFREKIMKDPEGSHVLDLSACLPGPLPLSVLTDPIFENAKLRFPERRLELDFENLLIGSIKNTKVYIQVLDKQRTDELIQITGQDPTVDLEHVFGFIIHYLDTERGDPEFLGKILSVLKSFGDKLKNTPSIQRMIKRLEARFWTKEQIKSLNSAFFEGLRLTGSSFSEKAFNEKTQLFYISPHDLFGAESLPGLGPSLGWVVEEVLCAVKEKRAPNLDRIKKDLNLIHLLFNVVNFLDLCEFQDSYLEPFFKKFPNVNLEQAPRSISSITLSPKAIQSFDFSEFYNIRKIEIKDFFNLTQQDLDFLPKERIRSLILRANSCENIRDFDFSGFENIEELDLISENVFMAEAFNSIPKAKLKNLKLDYVDVSGFDFGSLESIEELVIKEKDDMMGIRHWQFNGIPKAKLKKLKLDCVNVSGFDFGSLKSIEELKMNKVHWFLKSYFQRLPKENLRELVLRFMDITGFDFRGVENVEKLDLSGTRGFRRCLIPYELDHFIPGLGISDSDSD